MSRENSRRKYSASQRNGRLAAARNAASEASADEHYEQICDQIDANRNRAAAALQVESYEYTRDRRKTILSALRKLGKQ